MDRPGECVSLMDKSLLRRPADSRSCFSWVAAAACAQVSVGESERLCRAFVEEHLMTPDGGVQTSTKVKGFWFFKRPDREILSKSGVLSESVGLLMKYAVLAGDRDLFAREFAYLKKT
ncbi:MAG: hypothetical protein M5R36_20310 [Deltaproteobacteria bacterium]|nr:hypothetical protein [Deltaproteobacteria bacterium]